MALVLLIFSFVVLFAAKVCIFFESDKEIGRKSWCQIVATLVILALCMLRVCVLMQQFIETKHKERS